VPTLPLELWSLVFAYTSLKDLCACSMVCRQWQIECWAERRHLDLTGDRIDDAVLARICKASPKLNNLSLTLCTHLTDNAIQSLAASCSRITALQLDSCPGLTAKSINFLAELYGPALTSLKLKAYKKLSNKCVAGIASLYLSQFSLCP